MKTLTFSAKQKPTLRLTPKYKGEKHDARRTAQATALAKRV